MDAKSVWKADLSGQGVKVIEGLRIAQARAVRARYPNGCTPCTGAEGKVPCKTLPSNYLCQGFQGGGTDSGGMKKGGAVRRAKTLSFASRYVRRALLTPQVNPGSVYRCGKRD